MRGRKDLGLRAAIQDVIGDLQAIVAAIGDCGERGFLSVHARAHGSNVTLALQIVQNGQDFSAFDHLDRGAMDHHHVDEVGL